MAADIDVINAALNKLGEPAITAVSDNSRPARLANRTYADIRDALLREYSWNFATKRTSLAADAEAPAWGFEKSYTLPGDCLRLLELDNDNDNDWRHEGNTIVTDISAPLRIRYIGSVQVGEMEATFREALAARLAMEWAEPLSQTTSKGESMATLYQNKLRVARTADGQEDRVKVLDFPLYVQARF